jgi:endonuclease G
MNKLLLLILLLIPITGWSSGAPCSGKKLGISHCDGSQFVCNDGSVSRSTKDCSSYYGGTAKFISSETTKSTFQSESGIQDKTLIKQSGNILELNYPGFTIWLDCNERGPIKFRYVAQRDNGSFKRYDKFFIDQNVPAECQQKTANAYGHGYDRGHQVPANHLDSSEAAIKATNSMTNILPQASNRRC